MNGRIVPVVSEVVLVGGGHSHVQVLKSFGMKPIPGVRITLISRDADTPYSGMLPGHVAGHYTHEECHIDLLRLGKFAKARTILGNVVGVDREQKVVHLTSLDGHARPPIAYDVLSINIGSSPDMSAIQPEGTMPTTTDASTQVDSMKSTSLPVTAVKPISGFSERWQVLVDKTRTRSGNDLPTHIGVVGSGAGGVELALAMHYRLQNEARSLGKNPEDLIHFSLFSSSNNICSSFPSGVQRRLHRVLTSRGINLVLVKKVVGVDGDMLVLEGGERSVAMVECIWCTHASAQPWIRDAGFDVDDRGFLCVNKFLQSTNTPDVFASGDIAELIGQSRPKAGVFAVRQGPPLTHNIIASVRGKSLEAYVAQNTFLSLISTGNAYGVAAKAGLTQEGAWVWKLKDHIDRKFMNKFGKDLPDMDKTNKADTDKLQAQLDAVGRSDALKSLGKLSMRCGGCGSKVGATVLSNVMKTLTPFKRPEVLMGIDSPDDCAMLCDPCCHANKNNKEGGSVTLQTVDYFRSFLDDPYLFGQVAANHALSDCHAMGAEAVSAMAIAVVPFAAEHVVENELKQMMAGVCDVLEQDECALVGGHTSEGMELAMGLSVTGKAANAGAVMRKGGVRAGQVLILTKGVGTGTIMAAHMKLKAKGVWVKAALDSMVMSNKPAAQVLKAHGATSCTDVTGFGLLGHLVEMVQASDKEVQSVKANRSMCVGLEAVLKLDDVPILPGAAECVAAGVFSSLQPQNLRLKRAVVNQKEATKREKFPLLFDPQTAGGLLASVPESKAVDCIAALKAAGCVSAAVIGYVRDIDSDRVGAPEMIVVE